VEFQCGLNALVVRDLVTLPRAQKNFPDCHVANEHLVEVAALAVSLSAGVDCRSETEVPHLLDDICHVIVEVTTGDNRSIGVLFDNVPNDLYFSDSPVLKILLLSWLEIAIKNLDIVVAELQLSPAEESSQCLYQLKSGVGSGSVPTATTSPLHGLVGPEAVEIEGRLKLRLVETDHLRSVVLEEIVDDLLFGLGVQTSDVEGDQFDNTSSVTLPFGTV
jgi:hypothetical protein